MAPPSRTEVQDHPCMCGWGAAVDCNPSRSLCVCTLCSPKTLLSPSACPSCCFLAARIAQKSFSGRRSRKRLPLCCQSTQEVQPQGKPRMAPPSRTEVRDHPCMCGWGAAVDCDPSRSLCLHALQSEDATQPQCVPELLFFAAGLAQTLESGRRSRKRLPLCCQSPREV